MQTTQRQLAETIAVRVDLTEPLLTAHQIAALLAIPRSSVYEYARRKTDPLPSITVGRHRRFYAATSRPGLHRGGRDLTRGPEPQA